MKDLRLDTSTHDLAIEGLDLSLVDDQARVEQQIKIRLQFFKGEWFLDTDFGTPWFQEILGIKPPPVSRAETAIREQVLAVPDVEAIEEFSMDFQAAARTLQIDMRVRTAFGTVQVSEVLP